MEDEEGKVKKVNAIPGHSITLGALGCFILWFGWYGFNGAAAWDNTSLASIFLTTTIAPAVATVTTMLFTWIKNGKPDVSMCLNASLAGLVGITAGCDALDALGSVIVGIVSGILVVAVVEILDLSLQIDDPVGAISVHGVCGAMGTVLTGVFGDGCSFTTQLLGVAATAAYVLVMSVLVFTAINKTIGLRVSREEEIDGLDVHEHGASAYADFNFRI